ncbi:MAG: AraC family transcriptional regulator [Parahaliea sp.]
MRAPSIAKFLGPQGRTATRGEFAPSLSPRFAIYVRSYLLDLGVDPAALFMACGLDDRACEQYSVPLPVGKVLNLFAGAAGLCANPALGLDMARRFHFEASSLLIHAMVTAPSVVEGLRCLRRYDRFVDTALEIHIEVDDDCAEFSCRVLAAPEADTLQLSEYLLAFLAHILASATRRPVPAGEVHFTHHNAQNRTVLEEFFRAPVSFGQDRNLLRFDSAYLQQRFYSSDSLLHSVLIQALHTYFGSATTGHDIVEIICRELIRAGSDEAVTLEGVAERLAMSPRTLRRRLADTGYCFQEVKKIARERRAKHYLSHTSMPLSEIAFELGYSEPSAFSRAFRSWVGQSPQAYREHAALDTAPRIARSSP